MPPPSARAGSVGPCRKELVMAAPATAAALEKKFLREVESVAAMLSADGLRVTPSVRTVKAVAEDARSVANAADVQVLILSFV
mmetsp:Transcript_16592/g.47776  ORF Transcript_16592/g.47776 Transcript_16592/m.47776 type:complete len:83 (-) Transcript_16592:140-388(-)